MKSPEWHDGKMAQVGHQLRSVWPPKLMYFLWHLFVSLLSLWFMDYCLLHFGLTWRLLEFVPETQSHRMFEVSLCSFLTGVRATASLCGFLYLFSPSVPWLENRLLQPAPAQRALQWWGCCSTGLVADDLVSRGGWVCCPRQSLTHTFREQRHFHFRHYRQSSFS